MNCLRQRRDAPLVAVDVVNGKEISLVSGWVFHPVPFVGRRTLSIGN